LTFNASDLTANDSKGANESGQTLTVTQVITTSNTHGTVSLAGGNITYTPDANFNGAAAFDYQVCDNGTTSGAADAKCATATVNLTVNSVNDAPTADGQSATTAEDTSKNITLSGGDVDGDSLTYVVTQPAHGSVSCAGASCTYTPAADYNGADSFTFKTNDGATNSATATVSITVTAVNDAPTITATGGISLPQNTAPTRLQIAAAADIDNPIGALTVKVNGANSATVGGVTVSNILIDAGGNVTADVSTTAATSAQFTLTVSDGSLSSTAMLTVNVTYRFTGFFAPISNTGLNKATAGGAIPVKFSLSGYKGLAVIVSAVSIQIPCSGTGENGEEIPTTTAGGSGLSYDAATDTYTYTWKTEKKWKESCRRLLVTLSDGTSHTADFQFK
jgi:hypothetical protein